jgi:hypothetical protein
MSASMRESPVEEPLELTCKAYDRLVVGPIIESCKGQKADQGQDLDESGNQAIIQGSAKIRSWSQDKEVKNVRGHKNRWQAISGCCWRKN